MGDRPISRPAPTQDSTTQRNYPCVGAIQDRYHSAAVVCLELCSGVGARPLDRAAGMGKQENALILFLFDLQSESLLHFIGDDYSCIYTT